jgi:hypothetical protein
MAASSNTAMPNMPLNPCDPNFLDMTALLYIYYFDESMIPTSTLALAVLPLSEGTQF